MHRRGRRGGGALPLVELGRSPVGLVGPAAEGELLGDRARVARVELCRSRGKLLLPGGELPVALLQCRRPSSGLALACGDRRFAVAELARQGVERRLPSVERLARPEQRAFDGALAGDERVRAVVEIPHGLCDPRDLQRERRRVRQQRLRLARLAGRRAPQAVEEPHGARFAGLPALPAAYDRAMGLAVREGFAGPAGRRTWYRVAGDLDGPRPPLLCLHGGPGSTHHYFAPLERLANEGRAVVVYDQLGCGDSDRPDVDWTTGVFLDELDRLREHLGLARVHLLGTSWGGMLALEHVLRRPGGVAGLILSSTLASAEEWAAEAARLRDRLPGPVVAALERHTAAGTLDDPEYERALDVFDALCFFRGAVRPPELVRMRAERNVAVYRAMWGPNEWTITGGLAGWDVRPRLREIAQPTLVVRGAYDLCTERIAAALLHGIPHAREVVLAESSHTPVLEETERYLQVVRDFLRDAD